MESIQNEIIQSIRQKTSNENNLVDTLLDIIPMSKEAAYRRLRGEIPFTFEEAARICEKLDISLDRLIQVKNDKSFNFYLNSVISSTSMEDYYKILIDITKIIEYISLDPNSFTYRAEYTVPTIFSNKYYLISKVKLYRWIYQTDPQSIPRDFSKLEISTKYLRIQQECMDKIQKMECTIILNKHIFSTFVNQIKLFTELEVITLEEVQEVKSELLSMLNDLEIASASGFLEKGGKVHIYISEVFFDSTYLYMEGNKYKECAIRAYGLNYLRCKNPEMCDNQKTWIESLMRYCSFISGSGELQRNKYFRAQREIVNSL